MSAAEVIELEKLLLAPVARKDQEKLAQMLSDEFLEFGTSGMAYDKETIVDLLPKEESIDIEAFDFESRALAPDIVLLLYKTRRSLGQGKFSESLRSSIWKLIDQRWQLVFHQGTRAQFD